MKFTFASILLLVFSAFIVNSIISHPCLALEMSIGPVLGVESEISPLPSDFLINGKSYLMANGTFYYAPNSLYNKWPQSVNCSFSQGIMIDKNNSSLICYFLISKDSRAHIDSLKFKAKIIFGNDCEMKIHNFQSGISDSFGTFPESEGEYEKIIPLAQKYIHEDGLVIVYLKTTNALIDINHYFCINWVELDWSVTSPEWTDSVFLSQGLIDAGASSKYINYDGTFELKWILENPNFADDGAKVYVQESTNKYDWSDAANNIALYNRTNTWTASISKNTSNPGTYFYRLKTVFGSGTGSREKVTSVIKQVFYPFRISGKVTDADNTPLESVKISFDSDEYGDNPQITTDSNGYYTTRHFPNGDFRIIPALTGYSFNTVWAEIDNSDIVVNIKANYPLSGKVTDPVFPEKDQLQVTAEPLFRWNAVSGVLKYIVYLDTKNPPERCYGEVSEPSFNGPMLDYDRVYFWKIDSLNQSNDKTEGEIFRFRVEENPHPAKTVLIYPGDIQSNVVKNIKMSWNSANRAESYILYYGKTNPPITRVDLPVSPTEYSPLNLEYGEKYYWRVHSVNQLGLTLGDIWEFTIQTEAAPAPPAQVQYNFPQINALDMPNKLSLTWLPVESISKYKIYFGTVNPPAYLSYTLPDTTEFPLENLEYNQTYYWQINSCDDANETIGPIYLFKTMESPVSAPAVPIAIFPSEGSSNITTSANLIWSQVTDTLYYKIYFGKTNPPEFKTDQSVTDTDYDPGTLDYNTDYYWKIESCNDQGCSSSNIFSFHTASPPMTAPEKVSSPIPQNGSEQKSINGTLSWNAVDNVTSYKVYFGSYDSLQLSEANIPSDLNWNYSGLEYGKWYYWRIDSVNSVGTTMGDLWSFKTDLLLSDYKAYHYYDTWGSPPSNQIRDPEIVFGGRADNYDIYFGTSSAVQFKTRLDVVPNYSGRFNFKFDFSDTFLPGETYYLRADSVSPYVQGDLWTFTTLPNEISTIYPAYDEENVPVNATLTWNQPDGAASFKVFLCEDSAYHSGWPSYTDPAPVLIYSNHYSPSNLKYSTKYHITIIPLNSNGGNGQYYYSRFITESRVSSVSIEGPDIVTDKKTEYKIWIHYKDGTKEEAHSEWRENSTSHSGIYVSASDMELPYFSWGDFRADSQSQELSESEFNVLVNKNDTDTDKKVIINCTASCMDSKYQFSAEKNVTLKPIGKKIGDDNFGYIGYVDDYQWIEISQTGLKVEQTAWNNFDTQLFNLTFGFNYYGNEYNTLYLNPAQGFITFNLPIDEYINANKIPSVNALNNFISFFCGRFLDVTEVYSQTIGEPENRTFIIQCERSASRYLKSDDLMKFQILLNESDSSIKIQYHTLHATHDEFIMIESFNYYSNIGIENADGSDGILYSFGTRRLLEKRALTFAPSVKISGTVSNLESGIPYSGANIQGLLENIKSDSNGSYTTTVPKGWSGNISAVKDDDFFSPGNFKLTNIQNNCTLNFKEYFAIDGYGYKGKITDFKWIDISDTGTILSFNAENWDIPEINPGFSFTFYNQIFSKIYVCKSGYLILNNDFVDAVNSETYIHHALPFRSIIAPFWHNETLFKTTVKYKILGSAPNRMLIVNWENSVEDFCFQAVLSETDSTIQFNYKNMTSDGSDATVGICNGIEKAQYCFNEPKIAPNMSIIYDFNSRIHKISGKVITPSGTPVPNVALTGLPGTPVSLPDGSYISYVNSTEKYHIVPVMTSKIFMPETLILESVFNENENIDFVCHNSSDMKSISGKVEFDIQPDLFQKARICYPIGSKNIDDSGIFSINLPVGTSGTVKPECYGYVFNPSQIDLSPGIYDNLADINFSAIRKLRKIKVSLSPPHAVSSGGKWRLSTDNENIWRDSESETDIFLDENITVIFKEIDSYSKPPTINANITDDHTFSATYQLKDNYSVSAVAFEWFEIKETGNQILYFSDNEVKKIQIGFPFYFYENTFTELQISTNGALFFKDYISSNQEYNVRIPNIEYPNNFIAAFWDDLKTDLNVSRIFYELKGVAPNRKLIIQWDNIKRDWSNDYLTFQIILEENSNQIKFNYKFLTGPYSSGNSATIGIENPAGTDGLQYSFAQSSIHSGTSLCFSPPFTGIRIGGYITDNYGLPIENVTVSGFDTPLVSNVDGFFSTNVDFNWSGNVIFSKKDLLFSPERVDIEQITKHCNNLKIQAVYDPSITYIVSGKVFQKDGISPAENIHFTGLPGNISSDSSGSFEIEVPAGLTSLVTPFKDCYVFEPDSFSIDSLGDNLNISFIAGTTFEISGTVTDHNGNPLSEVSIGGFGKTESTNDSGIFKIYGGSYLKGEILPIKDGYTFSPASICFDKLTSNHEGTDFRATINTYHIRGTIRDFWNNPIKNLELSLNFQNTITDENGNFDFLVPHGFSGKITPTMANYSFSPAFCEFTLIKNGVANVDFTGTSQLPLPPADFTCTESDGSVILAWSKPLLPDSVLLSGYKIFCSENPLTSYEMANVELTESSTDYSLKNLVNGTQYNISIVTFNGNGMSTPLSEVKIPARAPDQVSNFIVTPFFDRVEFIWEAPSYNGGSVIEGYRILRKIDLEYKTIYTSLDDNQFVFSDSNPILDQEISYIIAAYNRMGTGKYLFSQPFTIPSTPKVKSPIISGKSFSNSRMPCWTWTSGGGGTGKFRYALNGDIFSETLLTQTTSFTPSADLIDGTYFIYVQEMDDLGYWSDTAIFKTIVDLIEPTPPIVNGETPSGSNYPTWTWVSAKNDGNGVFRYKFGDTDFTSGANETTDLSYKPSIGLSIGKHTLFVQERDDAGNWSQPGAFEIEVINEIPKIRNFNITDTLYSSGLSPQTNELTIESECFFSWESYDPDSIYTIEFYYSINKISNPSMEQISEKATKIPINDQLFDKSLSNNFASHQYRLNALNFKKSPEIQDPDQKFFTKSLYIYLIANDTSETPSFTNGLIVESSKTLKFLVLPSNPPPVFIFDDSQTSDYLADQAFDIKYSYFDDGSYPLTIFFEYCQSENLENWNYFRDQSNDIDYGFVIGEGQWHHTLNTSTIPNGTYLLRARVLDNSNPEVIVTAKQKIKIYHILEHETMPQIEWINPDQLSSAPVQINDNVNLTIRTCDNENDKLSVKFYFNSLPVEDSNLKQIGESVEVTDTTSFQTAMQILDVSDIKPGLYFPMVKVYQKEKALPPVVSWSNYPFQVVAPIKICNVRVTNFRNDPASSLQGEISLSFLTSLKSIATIHYGKDIWTSQRITSENESKLHLIRLGSLDPDQLYYYKITAASNEGLKGLLDNNEKLFTFQIPSTVIKASDNLEPIRYLKGKIENKPDVLINVYLEKTTLSAKDSGKVKIATLSSISEPLTTKTNSIGEWLVNLSEAVTSDGQPITPENGDEVQVEAMDENGNYAFYPNIEIKNLETCSSEQTALSPLALGASTEIVTLTGETLEYTLKLEKGYNLVALPMKSDLLLSPKKILEKIGEKANALYNYSADTGSYKSIFRLSPDQFLDGNPTLNTTSGFFIRMKDSGALTFKGVKLKESPPIILRRGFNMITFPYGKDFPAKTDTGNTAISILKELGNDAKAIYSYNKGKYIVVFRISEDDTNNSFYAPAGDFNLEQGKAYFLKMDKTGILNP
ncbi:MAG: hypothetical protein CVV64_17765 [Candidatus Wallbacteria bacterium HGW-Wallbacteria-1]|jgi:hypothetical protein|uniref:Fibronectin type-III domain-containing protein n=1 Tax=Candidatus Wallbacteria bacterium HGW-Wallbacteria-1 TaxID=2013854 RepID=A0A2N1PK27_9BACT|nr:MAG: hypothetical protein CVV64_17765 [Candidatus Wallbacteria bacterium HGW-Wallbacteria-1]